MDKGSDLSHVGPFHHKEWLSNSLEEMPLEAQSAGLLVVGTWCQVVGGKSLRILAILFPTKVLYLLEFPSSQASTIVLLHQAWTSCKGMSRAFLTEVMSLERSVAPHSSNLGIESCFKGATLVLAVTRVHGLGKWLGYRLLQHRLLGRHHKTHGVLP